MFKSISNNKIILALAATALMASPMFHSAAYGDSIDISTGIAGTNLTGAQGTSGNGANSWQVAYVAEPVNSQQPNYTFNGPLASNFEGPDNQTVLTAVDVSKNGNWIAPVGNSSWVGPHSWSSTSGSLAGAYVYQLDLGSLLAGEQYTITGETTASAVASSDNNFIGGAYLSSVTGNNTTVTDFALTPDGSAPGSGENVQDFKIQFTAPTTVGGTAGTSNYLDFVVNNGLNTGVTFDPNNPTASDNPTGLDLSAVLNSSLAPVGAIPTTPLPTSALGGLVLCTFVGLVGRRRALGIV